MLGLEVFYCLQGRCRAKSKFKAAHRSFSAGGSKKPQVEQFFCTRKMLRKEVFYCLQGHFGKRSPSPINDSSRFKFFEFLLLNLKRAAPEYPAAALTVQIPKDNYFPNVNLAVKPMAAGSKLISFTIFSSGFQSNEILSGILLNL